MRQLFPLVKRRRRRKLPFERRRALPPRISSSHAPATEGLEYPVEEDQRSDAGEIRAVGGDHVPPGEGVRIVDIAARHASNAEEMLREEDQVHADEHQPE